jgi:hypothetical protein
MGKYLVVKREGTASHDFNILDSSVVDPKLFVTDPDPTFLRVTDPDPTFKKSSGSGFGSDPKYLLFLQS